MNQLNDQQLTLSIGANGTEPTQAFRIEGKNLIIPEDLSWPEYVTGMSLFKKLIGDSKLYHAQYVRFGQIKFGLDKVNECMSQLEFVLDDAKKAVDIASVPDDVRHESLGAEHYTVLARSGLKAKQMAKWAKTADEQKLTPGQLKASIKHGEVITEAQARQENNGVLSLTGIGMSIEVWLRRIGNSDKKAAEKDSFDALKHGLKLLAAKPADQRKMLAGQIKIAVDIHSALTKPIKKAAKKKPAKKKAA